MADPGRPVGQGRQSRIPVASRPALAQRLAEPALGLGMVLLVLAAIDLFVPLRGDVFGLSRVLAPYLALLFLPLGLLALSLRGGERRRLGLVVAAGVALALLRFLPMLPAGASSADPALPQVRVATWNLYRDAALGAALIPALADRAPGIVGLQELTPSVATAIATDAGLHSAFPYRVLDPADDWSGMGLLSSWPIEGQAEIDPMPPLIAATIRRPQAPAIDVIVAHAPPARVGLGPLGPTYDPTRRDASLRALSQRVQAGLEAGRRVVLLGDLNVTDREVAYTEVVAGLTDSHRAAGSGLGHTWRPFGDWLPFAVLRIDVVLSGPGTIPLASAPDCARRSSDHCILDVVLAIEPD